MDLEGEGRVLESQLQTGQHTGHWLHPRLLTSVTSLIWSLYNDTQRLCASQHPSLIHVICADVRKLEGRSSSYLKEIKQLTWAQFAGNRILYFVGNIFKEFVLTRVNCCTGSLCHLLVNTLNCDHTGLELLESLSCEQKRWVFTVLIYFCVLRWMDFMSCLQRKVINEQSRTFFRMFVLHQSWWW